MQSLLGGGDKGSASNPLKRVGQREGVDNSLFRDRFVPKAGSSSRQGGSQQQAPSSQQAHNVSREPFNLASLSTALSVQHAPQSHSPSWRPNLAQLDSSWSSSLQSAQSRQRNASRPAQWTTRSPASQVHTPQASEWADSFHHFNLKGKGRAEPLPMQAHGQYNQHLGMGYQPYRPQIGYQPIPLPLASSQILPMHSPAEHLRSDEEQKSMEQAFEKALADARNGETAEDQDVEEIPRDRDADGQGDFEAVWQSLRPEAERLNQLAEWERDFSQFVDGEDDLYDTLNDSLHRNGLGQAGLDEQMDLGPFGPGFVDDMRADDGLPRHEEYDFQVTNPTDHTSMAEAWREANRLFASGGSLAEVTLLLETFISRASTDDYAQVGASEVEAWSLLGQTHAMNEKEEKALSAFEEGRRAMRGIEVSSVRGVGETFTNLAISYVNETLDLAALTTLHQYLATSFPSHARPAPLRSAVPEEGSPWHLHQQLRDAYLALAREQYNRNGQVDPNVQVGLGTLCYMMGDYGEARGCWVAALDERPDDYLLWNRLGATLANGGNSEEAVDAYRRALELRPTFTRAIFNLGVACLNIGVHKEAAEHFLAALQLHDSDLPAEGTPGGDSMGLWMVLRRALVALNLHDLADKAHPGTNLAAFKDAGFEF